MRIRLLSLIFALSFIAPPAFSQGTNVPVLNGLEQSCQMFSLTTYFNVPTYTTIYSTGTQVLDTGVNTTPLNLYVARLVKGKVNTDTMVVMPLLGQSKSFTMIGKVLKCTGTPTVVATPQMSNNGIDYVPIPGVAAQTVVPGSLTAPVYVEFNLTTKPAKYLAISYSGTGSSSFSAQTSWWYLKDQVVQLPKP